jgi:hypothetical protein
VLHVLPSTFVPLLAVARRTALLLLAYSFSAIAHVLPLQAELALPLVLAIIHSVKCSAVNLHPPVAQCQPLSATPDLRMQLYPPNPKTRFEKTEFAYVVTVDNARSPGAPATANNVQLLAPMPEGLTAVEGLVLPNLQGKLAGTCCDQRPICRRLPWACCMCRKYNR